MIHLSKCLRVGLPDRMASFVSLCKKEPNCIPINCSLNYRYSTSSPMGIFSFNKCIVISYCGVNIHFPWWVMVLNNFSTVHLQSVCLLWRNTCSHLWPIYCFCCWVLTQLSIPWKIHNYNERHYLQFFFPACGLSFHSIISIFGRAKVFNFH